MKNSTRTTRNNTSIIKNIILTALTVLTIVSTAFANGNPTTNPETAEGVQFEKTYSFDEVLRRAKAENKPNSTRFLHRMVRTLQMVRSGCISTRTSRHGF